MATEQEILQFVATALWKDMHNGAECPADRIPTFTDICESFEGMAFDATDGLASVAGGYRWGKSETGTADGVQYWLGAYRQERTEEPPNLTSEPDDVDVDVRRSHKINDDRPAPPRTYLATRRLSVNALHARWLALQIPRPPHPLAPLARAWWADKAPEVEPERRKRGIMAAPFARRLPEQAFLPGLTPPHAPGLVTLADLSDMAYLPGLEPDGQRREIPALLQLYDVATGGKVMRGGADLALAIFVEGLLSVPTATRSELRRVGPFTIGEIAGEWLQWNRKHYRPSKRETGAALHAALLKIRDFAVPINGRGGYFPLLLRAFEGMRWQDRVYMLAQLPSGAEVGPRIDRNVLRVLRKRSAPAYRAYLSLCFDWDYYGARGGKLTLSTRPVAVRNEQGYILDPSGDVVTGNGGVPIKSPYDNRAILTGERESNPAARNLYPPYDADDLVRLCYPVSVYEDAETRRKMRKEAKAAVRLVAQTGAASIEPEAPHRGNPNAPPWRIMPRFQAA